MRGNKRNIRGAFQIMLMTVSSLTLFLVLLAQTLSIIRSHQKEGTSVSVSRTNDQIIDLILSFIETLIPNYNEAYTLFQVIIVFLFSLFYLKSRAYEEQESLGRSEASYRHTDPIPMENIESMRNYQVQRSVQLIKDYKFKAKMAVQVEVILLAFVSSISCTILVLPYSLLFLIMCVVLTLTGQSKSLFLVSRKLNLVFIALLLVDLPAKYFIKGSHFVNVDDTNQQRFFSEVIGLLSSLPTYLEFYLKILLFLVECQKIQFSYDYSEIYSQIYLTHSDRYELQRLFRKRISFNYKIFKPISIFAFSSLSVLFAFCHPSIILLALMPVFIFGFFLNQEQYRTLSKILVLIVSTFVLASQVSQIVYLLLPIDQTKQDFIEYAQKLLGIESDVNITTQVFPCRFDFFFCLIMAFFSSYIQKREKQLPDNASPSHINSMIREGFEDDILTIPDDVSEARSKISYKVPPSHLPQISFSERSLHQKTKKQYDTGEVIKEEEKEDEHEEDKASTEMAFQHTNTQQISNPKKRSSKGLSVDDTLRGKMRRGFFKAYFRIRIYFDKFLNLLTIHSSKFTLFAIFLVSVLKANLLNASLFLVFLWLSVTDNRNIRSNWKYPIIVDSLIIMFLYSLEVLAPAQVFNLDHSILDFIGISPDLADISSNQLKARLLIYLPYFGLLVILILSYYIMNSDRFDQFLKVLLQLDQENWVKKEDLEHSDQDDDQVSLSQKTSSFYPSLHNQSYVGLTDKLSKFIVKHSIYFLILAMFIQCALPPASLLNFILLVLLVVVIFQFLYSKTQISLYKKLTRTLSWIKWVSFLILFLKYTFQFQEVIEGVSQLQSDGDLTSFYLSQSIIEKIMGVDRSQYISLKLFSLAMVLVISNYQLSFGHHVLLQGILREELQSDNKLKFLDLNPAASQSRTIQKNIRIALHFLKTYLLLIIKLILFPVPAVLLLRYTIQLPSLIGIVLVASLIMIFYQHQATIWKHYYQGVGASAAISLTLIFIGYFIQLFLVDQNDFLFLQWIGVKKATIKDFVFFPQMLNLFYIIVVCCGLKYIDSFRSNYQVTVSEEDIQILEEKEIAKYANLQENEQRPDPNMELLRLKAIYEYEAPLRQIKTVKDCFIKPVFYMFGFQIMLICATTIILARLDFNSVIFAVFIVIIMNAQYYPMIYKESNEEKSKRTRLANLLKLNLILISILTLKDYVMSLGPAYMFDFTSWKGKFTSYLCYDNSIDCQNDWQTWLGLSDIRSYYLILDFVYLVMVYLNLFFVDERITLHEQNDDLAPAQPKLHDEKDFLSHNYQGSKINILAYQLVFNSFPYLLILALMVFATMFHGSGSADLISTVYLFHGFYYIVNFRKLYTKNTQLLKLLKYYNCLVLFTVIVFQSPMFICPSVQSFQGSFQYIKVQQCAALLQDNLEEQKYSSTNSYLALYIVFTQSVGFIKIYSLQVDFVILMAIVELQDYIFHHPYFQIYVLQHMQLEKDTDSKLRAFMFVEQTHLGVLWSYKAIKEEIRILHQRLVRINQVLKDHEHSKLFFIQGEEEQNEREALMDQKQRSGKYNMRELSIFEEGEMLQSVNETEKTKKELIINNVVEEITVKIEDLALMLLSTPNTPIIPLKLFISTFRQFLFNSEDFNQMIRDGTIDDHEIRDLFIQESLQEILKRLQKVVYDKHRNDLYHKEGVGLNFILQTSLTDSFPSMLENRVNLRKDYEDMIEMNDHYKQIVSDKASWIKRLSFVFRSFLWLSFVNKNLFNSMNQNAGYQSPFKIPLIKLISNCILSQSQNICYLVLFLNFIINPNILTLMPPISALLYAMLDYPVPSVRYWKTLMIYMFMTVALKFIYQLPIFCGTPPYSLFSIEGCQNNAIAPEILFNRIDYVIGIHKFAGPSSYPRDQGMLNGMIGDILVLLTLLILKNYLIKIGLWHFVKTKNNIYLSPAFKCKAHELSQAERLYLLRRENYKVYEYEQASIPNKIKYRLTQAQKYSKNFIMKLMPQFMDPHQRNLDLRTQDEREYIIHNPKRVKPGKDYFSQNFFALLIILVYNLLWYRNVTGEAQTVVISSANLQRFSTGQVILLFVILVLMMIERMLFRTRYVDSRNAFVNSGHLSKHQLTAKLAIHIFLVIVIHIWLGFVIPRNTLAILTRKTPLVFAYLAWVYYFIQSANQIRHGYPQAPFKPPFTRDTSFFNWWSFRIYKAIPFLWEMKVIVDWTVTSTSLDLFQWFKIDDAFNYLYQNQQQNNERKARPEYQLRPWYEKFFQGFCIAFLLILVILAPIFLFSGINPIMVKNPILSGSMQMSFELNSNGNTYSILQTQAIKIQQLENQDVITLSQEFNPINVQFTPEDMQKMSYSPYSEVEWSISPPSLQKFIQDYNDIKGNNFAYIDIMSIWNFKRNNPIGNEGVQSETSIRISAAQFQPIVDLLSQDYSLYGSLTQNWNNQSTIYVENIFPKVLKLGSTNQASILDMQTLTDMPVMSSIQLTLNRPNPANLYWTFQIQGSQVLPQTQVQSNVTRDQDMVLVVYNEEVIGTIFGSAFQFSVVGLYATIVIAIGRFLRLIFDRISQRVIYEEMKNTELLFEVCEGIFIAQVEGDLVKEKRLYELLISLYRSPETLIKLTGLNADPKQMTRLIKDDESLAHDKQQ